MGALYENQYIFSTISRLILLIMKNISDKSCRVTRNTTLYSVTFFLKSRFLLDNMEKYCRAGHDTYDNMAHAHCMLVT